MKGPLVTAIQGCEFISQFTETSLQTAESNQTVFSYSRNFEKLTMNFPPEIFPLLDVHCSLMVTCWERANLLALLYLILSCFCHFPMWCPGSGVVLDCIDS